MTEDEAREKWCPFVRLQYDHPAINRTWDTPNPGKCRCIASDCMAWRWAEQGHDPDDMPGIGEHPSTGYCGLAGKP